MQTVAGHLLSPILGEVHRSVEQAQAVLMHVSACNWLSRTATDQSSNGCNRTRCDQLRCSTASGFGLVHIGITDMKNSLFHSQSKPGSWSVLRPTVTVGFALLMLFAATPARAFNIEVYRAQAEKTLAELNAKRL